MDGKPDPDKGSATTVVSILTGLFVTITGGLALHYLTRGPDEGRIRMAVEERLRGWESAWERSASADDVAELADYHTRDFVYRAYYSNGESHEMVYREWREHRLRRARENSEIEIIVDNVELSSIEADKVTTTFFQRYRTGSYEDCGEKELQWRLDDGEWKVYRDVWRELGCAAG